MAADRPSKKEKKEKKEKKRSAEEGVKKDKKDRKDKKEKKAKLAAALDEHLQAEAAASALASGVMAVDVDEETTTAVVVAEKIAPLSMVPFAVPLADEKNMKKVLKTVRKGKSNSTNIFFPFNTLENPNTLAAPLSAPSFPVSFY
jgi:H/ACA ribonucleoprotein complex subunit 2